MMNTLTDRDKRNILVGAQNVHELLQQLADERAKVAELGQRVKWLETRHTEQTSKVNSYVIANADLERQLAATKEDTADMDWLSAQKYLCFGMGHFAEGWRVQIETGGYAERGMNLREAIRKARNK